MRKQYNFWPSDDGLLAWDVDRLISLSADLPVRMIELSDIAEIDTDYWFKDGQQATVRAVVEHAKLMASAELDYPVILAADGRVMDGMHRIAKALLLGMTSIAAVQFVEQPAPDFVGVRPEDLPYDR